MHAWMLLVPILFPVACAFLLMLPGPLQKPVVRRILLGTAFAIQAVAAVALAMQPDMGFTLFYITDRLPVAFCLDNMARVFSVLSSAMFLAAGVFSFEYMKHEQEERRFYLFFLMVAGMLAGIAYAGNLMTLYLFFEATTLLSVPLVLHTLTKEAVAAAFKYLFYSIGGASLALIGFFFVYAYGSTLAFTPGGVLDAEKLAGNETAMLAATLAAIVGFGAKAGLFPLHAWLPAAHPVAPAPASAVLSGVITKAGVFAIVRFVFQLIGVDFIRGTFVQYAWLGLSLFTILMGSVLAYREPLLKTRLAYSSVSQVAYIQFGLATLTTLGVLGGMLHMVFHSIIKDALFLAAGAIIMKTGKTRVDELSGLGKQMPPMMWCFTLLGVALVGIPPASGFVSKWNLAVGSLASGTGIVTWFGPVVLLISALLTAGYLFPISIHGFFPGNKVGAGEPGNIDVNVGVSEPGSIKVNADASEQGKIALKSSMLIPLVILTALAFLLGIFPGGLIGLLSQLHLNIPG